MLAVLISALVIGAPDPPGKQEFIEARALFDAGQPEEALPLFQKAYELSGGRSSALLALALCERTLEMFHEALEHLRLYVEKVPEDRERYAAILEELEERESNIEVKPPPPPPPVEPPPPPPPRVEAPPPPVPPPPIEPTVEPPVVPPPAPEPDSGPTGLKIGLLSSGGAAIVAGAVFAVLAATTKADVKSRVEDGVGPADEVVSDANTGFRYAVTADVLVGVGVITAGIGLFVD